MQLSFLSLLHTLLWAPVGGRQGATPAVSQQKPDANGLRSLIAVGVSAGFLGVGCVVHPLGADAHTNRCITLKGTALKAIAKSDLGKVINSEDSLSWQCLRIIENDSLETVDLSGLEELTYLHIKGNGQLAKIKFSSHPNLKYLYIDDNDDNDLKLENLLGLKKLVRLRIKDNKCLTNIELSSQPNLEYLDINNNDYLESVNFTKLTGLINITVKDNYRLGNLNFDSLTSLKCLYIKKNENLTEISAPSLTDAHCINISDNENLNHIDFPALVNVIHLKIDGNKKLPKTNGNTEKPESESSAHSSLPVVARLLKSSGWARGDFPVLPRFDSS